MIPWIFQTTAEYHMDPSGEMGIAHQCLPQAFFSCLAQPILSASSSGDLSSQLCHIVVVAQQDLMDSQGERCGPINLTIVS